MPRLVVDISAPSRQPNELAIVANGSKIAGWEDAEVALRAEGFPNSFAVTMSIAPPTRPAQPIGTAPAMSVATSMIPGAECQVYLGDNQIISGYIDSTTESAAGETHEIRVAGRGLTGDLVDCSAEWKGGQISGTSALDVITRLAASSSVVVRLADGAPPGDAVAQFNLNYGETAADVIQRVAHNAGLMAYEDNNGSLVLAHGGVKTASSGITYGDNVQSYSVEVSMDQRYSDIVCVRYSQDLQGDIGVGGIFFDTENDPGVPRHRLLYIPMEMASDPEDFTKKKAKWEQARRIGRSRILRVAVDSWADSNGDLWLPNTLVPVGGFPSIPDGELCISEVSFRRTSETGTTADLTLMDARGFAPEPFSLIQAPVADIHE